MIMMNAQCLYRKTDNSFKEYCDLSNKKNCEKCPQFKSMFDGVDLDSPYGKAMIEKFGVPPE
jgi:hypothetical protein